MAEQERRKSQMLPVTQRGDAPTRVERKRSGSTSGIPDATARVPSAVKGLSPKAGGPPTPFARSVSNILNLTQPDMDEKQTAPQHYIGCPTPAPLGLGDTTHVFAFDPILQLFVLATHAGALRLLTNEFEVVIENSEVDVTIEKLGLVPGVGRAITVAVSNTASSFSGHGGESLIQYWDFLQVIQKRLSPLGDMGPSRTVKVPYRVTALTRCELHRSTETTILKADGYGGQLMRKSLAGDARKSSATARSSSPPPREVAHSDAGRKKTSRPAVSTGRWTQFIPFSDDEGSPYPHGEPSHDSRWLFYCGSNRGDLRIVDVFGQDFEQEIVSIDRITNDITENCRVPASMIEACGGLKNVYPSGAIVSLAPHPFDPAVLLIGYSNGSIIVWDFKWRRATKVHIPQAVVGIAPSQTNTASTHFNSHPITTVPPSLSTTPRASSLQAITWHPSGLAFAAALHAVKADISASPTSESANYVDPRIYVFSERRAAPVVAISLEHVTRASLKNTSIPFLHWQNDPRSTLETDYIREVESSSPHCHPAALMRGKLYVLTTHPRSKPSASDASVRVARAACHSNVWRLAGSQWCDAQPVFPHGAINPSSPAGADVRAVQLFAPSIDQSPDSLLFPCAGTLAGLKLAEDMERDQSEEVEALITAAQKLTRYLMSATFLIGLTDFPSKQIVAACISLDEEKFRYIKDSVPLAGFGFKEEDDEEEEDDDDDFAPWETLVNPQAFQVNWASAALSNVTVFHAIPRNFGFKQNRIRRNQEPSLPSADEQWTSKVLKLANAGRMSMQEMESIFLDEFKVKSPQNKADRLDAFTDAMFTVKQKHVVHGWLSGLTNRRDRIYVGGIHRPDTCALVMPTKKSRREFTLASVTSAITPPAQSVGGSQTDDPSEDDEEAAAEEEEEWRFLNETNFFGDLLRPSKTTWNYTGPGSGVVGVCQGVLVTGHRDGLVRFWSYFHGALQLIHTLSIVSSYHYSLNNEWTPAPRATPTHHQLERIAALSVGATDAKPAVGNAPESPMITAIDVLIQGVAQNMPEERHAAEFADADLCSSPTPKAPAPSSPDEEERLVAVGCMTGCCLVFRWSSMAVDLPPPEASAIAKARAAPPPDDRRRRGAAVRRSSQTVGADQCGYQLPFGFHVLSRFEHHQARITAMRLKMCMADQGMVASSPALSSGDRTTASRPSGKRFFGRSVSRITALREAESGGSPDRQENELSFRLIAADTAGVLSISDVHSGIALRVLSATTLAGVPGGPEASAAVLNASTVEFISFTDRPLLFTPGTIVSPSQNQASVETQENQPTFAVGSDSIAVVCLRSGRVRQVHVPTATLLDDGKYAGYLGESDMSKGAGWKLFIHLPLQITDVPFCVEPEPDGWTKFGPTRSVVVRKDTARPEVSRWFLFVQAARVGLLEVRTVSTPTPLFVVTQVRFIDIDRETCSADLSFIDNTPTAVVTLRGGRAEMFCVVREAKTGSVTLQHVGTADLFKGVSLEPAHRRATILDSLNLYSGAWDTSLFISRKERASVPVYATAISKPRKALAAAFNYVCMASIRNAAYEYCRMAGIVSDSVPTSPMAGAAAPPSPRPAKKNWVKFKHRIQKWAAGGDQIPKSYSLKSFLQQQGADSSERSPAAALSPTPGEISRRSTIAPPQKEKKLWWGSASHSAKKERTQAVDAKNAGGGDAWSEARAAKSKLQQNQEVIQQAAASADRMDMASRDFLQLSTQLKQKYK